MSRQRGNGVLLAIAAFKLVKSCALIALGIAALVFARRGDTYEALHHVVSQLRLDPNNHLVNAFISKASGLSSKRLEELSVGTFVYAIVFLVEGTGLFLRKRWAEYLTIGITASFIPLELYELWHKPSVLKVAGVVVNALIVVYLVVRVRSERKESPGSSWATPAARG